MGDHFQGIQERIEGIFQLLRTTKKFQDRARLLCDMRELLDEADRIVQQAPRVESSEPETSRGLSAK
jgi:hypothetical protein